MAKSNEPIVWSLFSGGGVLAAFLVPVLIVVTGFVAPAGGISAEKMAAVLSHPLVRVALFLLVFLSFFHAAHRFRFTLVDIGLKPWKAPIAWGCYLAALFGTGWTCYTLLF